MFIMQFQNQRIEILHGKKSRRSDKYLTAKINNILTA